MNGQWLSGEVQDIVKFIIFSDLEVELDLCCWRFLANLAVLMIPNVQLHWMHMPIINRIPIVNSSLITPETTVNILRNPPLVTLTEYYNMRVSVDPIHWDDGMRAFVDPVSSEARNLFWEWGKKVSERGGLVSDCDVVEVPLDIIRNRVLVILNDVPSLLNRVYKD